MCGQCYAELLQAEYLAQLFYENATIYISKVAEVDRTIAHTVDSTATTMASSAASNNSLTSEDYISVTDEQVLPVANCRLKWQVIITDNLPRVTPVRQ